MTKKSKFQNVFDSRSQSPELNEQEASESHETKVSKVGRPSGKRSDDSYRQITLLLKKQTIKDIKSFLLDLDEKKDISEIVDLACQNYLKNKII